MAYTNVSPNAPWVSTVGTLVPWRLNPAYTMLDGFRQGFIQADILHMFHLGTGRDLVGSTLVLMLRGRDYFEGSTIEERLATATSQLKSFCQLNRYPLKLHKLSKTKLHWSGATMPELRSSGFDTYVVLRWILQDLIPKFANNLPRDLCAAIWSADHCLSIMMNGGHNLTIAEQRNKEVFGDVFMRAYVRLAVTCIQNRQRIFRLRPKLHIWHHILKCSPPSRTNPHKYATWMDEDSLKKLMRVHRVTDKRTAQERLLQRFILALPGTWLRKRET